MLLQRVFIVFLLVVSALATNDINELFLLELGLSDSVGTDGLLSPRNKEHTLWSLEHTFKAVINAYPSGLVLPHIVTISKQLATDEKLNGEELDKKFTSLEILLRNLPLGAPGFPGCRRVIVAALALRRIRFGAFTQECSLRIKHLLLYMFRQHKAAAKSKGYMEFTHISKCGGTSFCELAIRNGCMAPITLNCMVHEFRDQPRYINATAHDNLRGKIKTTCDVPWQGMVPRPNWSCSKRKEVLWLLEHNAYAMEYTAHGGELDPRGAHPCMNMLTVVEIRNPHERVLSHIAQVWSYNYGFKCDPEDRQVFFAEGHDTQNWLNLMPSPLNNYIIRSLLGEAVFNLPVGAITNEHLALAQAFLTSQYDVLLVLEDGGLNDKAMRCGLGWQQTDHRTNGRPNGSEAGMPSDLNRLWELNKLDVELYKYGIVVARLDGIVYDIAQEVYPQLRPPSSDPNKPPPPGSDDWWNQEWKRGGRRLKQQQVSGSSRRRLNEEPTPTPPCGWIALKALAPHR